MRAGTSTDDYLVLDDEIWTIVDSGPGVAPVCGICTGHTMYGDRREDHISYLSCLEVADGMLAMKGSFPRDMLWAADWRSKYDRFIGVERAGDEVPYTGWLLLYWGARWASSLEEGIFAPRLAEARFERGHLADFVEHTEELEALREGFPGDYGKRDFLRDDEERARVCGLISSLLTGEYNCTSSGFPQVAKRRGWGGKDPDGSYECANCNKLRDHGVIPLRAPKRPRKRRYREVGLSVPGFMPDWVRELAAGLDVQCEPRDGRPREPAAGMSEEEFDAFASGARWRFAETMPECPHWYTLREGADDRSFIRAVRYIRHSGFDCKWDGRAERKYLDSGGYYYWTMGSSDRETALINRCAKGDYLIDGGSMYFRGRQ